MCIHEQYFKLWGLKHHLNFLWLLQPSHWDGQSIMQDTSICSQVWLPLAMLFTRNRFQTCNMHIKLLLSFVYSMLTIFVFISFHSAIAVEKNVLSASIQIPLFLAMSKEHCFCFFLFPFFKKKNQSVLTFSHQKVLL